MSKHYTPSIEEFHIGFEYERLDIKGNYTSQTFGVTHSGNFDDCEDLINISRVKYLDQEDIESLGFELTGKAIGNWYAVKGSFEIGTWTTYELMINHIVKENYLYIYAMDAGDNVTIFQGTIKNKSELKRILKQIGYETDIRTNESKG